MVAVAAVVCGDVDGGGADDERGTGGVLKSEIGMDIRT